jgi:hypothetical protein
LVFIFLTAKVLLFPGYNKFNVRVRTHQNWKAEIRRSGVRRSGLDVTDAFLSWQSVEVQYLGVREQDPFVLARVLLPSLNFLLVGRPCTPLPKNVGRLISEYVDR